MLLTSPLSPFHFPSLSRSNQGPDVQRQFPPYASFSIFYICMLEKAMATHSSTLAWKIPLTGEPGGLQSMGSRRVGHDWATSLSLFTLHFHALEKEMATHSSVLAWRIPGTAEPGGLPSMGSHRVRHDWSDVAAAAAVYIRKKHKSWFHSFNVCNYPLFADIQKKEIRLFPEEKIYFYISSFRQLQLQFFSFNEERLGISFIKLSIKILVKRIDKMLMYFLFIFRKI